LSKIFTKVHILCTEARSGNSMMPNYTDDDGDTIIDDGLSTFGDDEERLSTTNILTSSQSAGLGPVTRNLRHFFTTSHYTIIINI